MNSTNIGWFFYRDYFDGIDYDNLKNKKNEEIIQKKVTNIINQTPKLDENEPLGNTHLTAKITYPGLLLGTGNTHELPSIEGQIILGFHFDYTSGLPVIQGSSIKGVLRSAFKHQEYIEELLKDTKINVKDLETEIFLNGDVFFDAPIVKADSYGKILGDDFLAPHGDNPLKDPKPLRFIKVLPDVTFLFDFALSDGLISKEKKVELFKNILQDLGLGAKTNVGYGKFENFAPYETKEEKKAKEEVLKLQKERVEKERLRALENAKKTKEQKTKEGLNILLSCKNFQEGLKILKESFPTAKPKLTSEHTEIVKVFADKFRKLAKPKEFKVLKKYGIS